MGSSGLLIRPALESDAEAVATVYAPYVRDTAVSFETDAPSAAVMAQRIADTTLTHPWLVAEREGAVVGYTYAAKHSQRPGYRWTVDGTIYVRNEERRDGVGRSKGQLIEQTENVSAL
jgi:L-amino acid N-acyltransferase YncA